MHVCKFESGTIPAKAFPLKLWSSHFRECGHLGAYIHVSMGTWCAYFGRCVTSCDTKPYWWRWPYIPDDLMFQFLGAFTCTHYGSILWKELIWCISKHPGFFSVKVLWATWGDTLYMQVYQCYRSGIDTLKKMRNAECCDPDKAETIMAELDKVRDHTVYCTLKAVSVL